MKLTYAAAASLAVMVALPAGAAAVRPPLTSVSHLAIYAADMAAADQFFTHNLGAAKRSDPEDAQGVRYYFNPIQFVEVLPLPAKEAQSKNRMDHMAYNTTDVKALKRYLAAHDIKATGGIHDGSDGSAWFDVKDPEGNVVQFVQPPKDPKPVADNPLSDHIIHFGFIVHDPDKENAFYRTVLGFRPYWWGGMHDKAQWISQQLPDSTDWVEYMVVSGPQKEGIPADMSQADAGVLDHFALGVGNMEKTVTLLTGGDRISEKNDGPKIGRDGKWQYNMYTPDGTRTEFMEFHAVTKPCCSPFTASDPEK